jgi:hypothetical protein
VKNSRKNGRPQPATIFNTKRDNDKKTAIRKEMMDKRQLILTKEQKDKIASFKAEREKRKDEEYGKKMEKIEGK